MPHKAVVTIEYGPYRACGMLKYRLSRIVGLQKLLKFNDHEVILEKINDWNIVNLIVNGVNVFSCREDDLDYNGDGKLDGLCLEAVNKVLLAY